jgi:anti-anti-sigma factor
MFDSDMVESSRVTVVRSIAEEPVNSHWRRLRGQKGSPLQGGCCVQVICQYFSPMDQVTQRINQQSTCSEGQGRRIDMTKTTQMKSHKKLNRKPQGVFLIDVSGKNEPAAVENLELAIEGALAAMPCVIIVDLSKAQSVSTIILGRLLKLRRAAVERGGAVRLVGVHPMVRRILNICRLEPLFEFFPSMADAIQEQEPAAAM